MSTNRNGSRIPRTLQPYHRIPLSQLPPVPSPTFEFLDATGTLEESHASRNTSDAISPSWLDIISSDELARNNRKRIGADSTIPGCQIWPTMAGRLHSNQPLVIQPQGWVTGFCFPNRLC